MSLSELIRVVAAAAAAFVVIAALVVVVVGAGDLWGFFVLFVLHLR
jgi:hypothetical protein